MSLASQVAAGFTRVAQEFNALRTDIRNGYRIDQRVGTVASSATPSINTDLYDMFKITALAVNITSMTSGLSGTPTDGQELTIVFMSAGTYTIAWGTSFENSMQALPPQNYGLARMDVKFVYNSNASKWRCMGVA